VRSGLRGAAFAALVARCLSHCVFLAAGDRVAGRRLSCGGVGAPGGQVVGKDRTRRWHRRGRASRAVVGRPRVRRARSATAGVVVVGGLVVWSSVGRGCGAQAALLLVSLSFWRKWRGHRSAVGAARRRRCCSCRCRRAASGVVVGRPRVRRAGGGAARVVVVWAQVAWSSVGRGCGAHAAVLLVSMSSGGKWRGRRSAAGAARTRRCFSRRRCFGASGVVDGRRRVQRARGAPARFVVVGRQVAWSSVGGGCGAHAAVLLVSLSFWRKWRGHRSAVGAARRRRCCSCRCRRAASGVLVGRPWVRRARHAAARFLVVGGQGSWSSVRRTCGAQAALLPVSLWSGGKSCGRRSAAGAACTRQCCSCRCRFRVSGVVVDRPRVRRARGGAARVVVVGGPVAWSSVGRGCGAHAAVLLVSLSFCLKWRSRRSAAGAARRGRCCSCRCRFGASGVYVGRPRVWRARGGAARC